MLLAWTTTCRSRSTWARWRGYCRNSSTDLRRPGWRHMARETAAALPASSAGSYGLRKIIPGLGASALATNRGIQFAAVHKDRRRQIEKHHRDHDRREARIVSHVRAANPRRVGPERKTAGEPQQQRGNNAGQDRAKPPPAPRQPLVRNHQRNDERQARDRITRDGEIPFERREPGRKLDRGCEEQR